MEEPVTLGGGYTCSVCGQYNRTSALCHHLMLIPKQENMNKNQQLKIEEKMYSESEVIELCKKVLDTFHSEGPTKSGKPRLARIKFNNWIKQNLK